MKAKLTSVDLFSPFLEFEIVRWPAIVGTDRDCDLRWSDRWLGRRHCEILVREDGLFVRSLGPEGSTLIDGRAISSSPLLPKQTLTVVIRSFQVNYRPARSSEKRHRLRRRAATS